MRFAPLRLQQEPQTNPLMLTAPAGLHTPAGSHQLTAGATQTIQHQNQMSSAMWKRFWFCLIQTPLFFVSNACLFTRILAGLRPAILTFLCPEVLLRFLSLFAPA